MAKTREDKQLTLNLGLFRLTIKDIISPKDHIKMWVLKTGLTASLFLATDCKEEKMPAPTKETTQETIHKKLTL